MFDILKLKNEKTYMCCLKEFWVFLWQHWRV